LFGKFTRCAAPIGYSKKKIAGAQMAVFSVPIGHGASFRHMPRWHAMVGSPASEVGVVFMRLG